jgi:hypothetical protein
LGNTFNAKIWFEGKGEAGVGRGLKKKPMVDAITLLTKRKR